jgi:hypothetical protein
MKMKNLFRTAVVAACLLLISGVSSGESSASSKRRTQEKRPNISGPENEAIQKINKAKDAAAKLDASAEYVRKFPQSPYRPEVAKFVAQHVNSITDVPQRIALNERFITIFNLPAEIDLVTEGLATDYLSADRVSDAFRIATPFLKNHPDQIDLKRILAITATNESIKGNNSLLKQGQEYGLDAIAQIEADRKPPDMAAPQWGEYKAKYLAALYREVGVLAMRGGDSAVAKTSLEKAVSLKSPDPIVYFFLSHLANDEYQKRAIQNKSIADAAQKAADLKQVEQLLDRVIELFAQTIAIAEGNAQFAEASKVMRGDLEKYYGFRHGSTQGVQALIDKYKKPSP